MRVRWVIEDETGKTLAMGAIHDKTPQTPADAEHVACRIGEAVERALLDQLIPAGWIDGAIQPLPKP